MIVRADDINRFAKRHYKENDPQQRWNGRQIRNAFHIAVAMAEDHAAEKDEKAAEGETKKHTPVLKASYFQLVEDSSTKFDDYLHQVHGMGKQDLAKQNSTRRDDWDRGKRDRKSKTTDRRRQVESSESSGTDSSDGEANRYSSSGNDEDVNESSEEGDGVHVEESSSSEEEVSIRERHKRLDRKISSKKEHRHGSGEVRKDGTRNSRKGIRHL
jgi:hypothetical protein